MNFEIIGLVIIIISIGFIKYSSFIGAILLIIGISTMIKGKNNKNKGNS